MQILLNEPSALFISHGEIYICDTENHRVRKLLCNGRDMVTIAGTGIAGYNGDGQPATQAQLNRPRSVVVSPDDEVFIAEDIGHRIRKIDRHGIISTLAGTGQGGYNGDGQLAIHAQVYFPYGLFVTEEGDVLFCDFNNYRIRRIDRRSGMIGTVVGNGERGIFGDVPLEHVLATEGPISQPTSVVIYKGEIYFTEYIRNYIRKVDRNGMITTLAGTGVETYNGDQQPAKSAAIQSPDFIFVKNDKVYFCDTDNCRIRMIDRHGMIHTIAGGGWLILQHASGEDGTMAVQANISPVAIFVDDDAHVFFIEGNRVRRIEKRSGVIRTIVGCEECGYAGDVEFDFEKYPHVGPKRKRMLIKPFPNACHDIVVKCID